MVQHDVNLAWEALTDTEKRRIFAIWCVQPPERIDWKKVAAALGSSSGEANRVGHFNALKKLRNAGAVIESDETPSASAATTPTPTPKKPRGKKRKAEKDIDSGDIGGDGEAASTPRGKTPKKAATPATDGVKTEDDA